MSGRIDPSLRAESEAIPGATLELPVPPMLIMKCTAPACEDSLDRLHAPGSRILEQVLKNHLKSTQKERDAYKERLDTVVQQEKLGALALQKIRNKNAELRREHGSTISKDRTAFRRAEIEVAKLKEEMKAHTLNFERLTQETQRKTRQFLEARNEKECLAHEKNRLELINQSLKEQNDRLNGLLKSKIAAIASLHSDKAHRLAVSKEQNDRLNGLLKSKIAEIASLHSDKAQQLRVSEDHLKLLDAYEKLDNICKQQEATLLRQASLIDQPEPTAIDRGTNSKSDNQVTADGGYQVPDLDEAHGTDHAVSIEETEVGQRPGAISNVPVPTSLNEPEYKHERSSTTELSTESTDPGFPPLLRCVTPSPTDATYECPVEKSKTKRLKSKLSHIVQALALRKNKTPSDAQPKHTKNLLGKSKLPASANKQILSKKDDLNARPSLIPCPVIVDENEIVSRMERIRSLPKRRTKLSISLFSRSRKYMKNNAEVLERKGTSYEIEVKATGAYSKEVEAASTPPTLSVDETSIGVQKIGTIKKNNATCYELVEKPETILEKPSSPLVEATTAQSTPPVNETPVGGQAIVIIKEDSATCNELTEKPETILEKRDSPLAILQDENDGQEREEAPLPRFGLLSPKADTSYLIEKDNLSSPDLESSRVLDLEALIRKAYCEDDNLQFLQLVFRHAKSASLESYMDRLEKSFGTLPVTMKLEITDGLIYCIHVHGYVICIPRSRPLRNEIIQQMHILPDGKHVNAKTTHDHLCERYYWPDMGGDVVAYTAACILCQSTPPPPSSSTPLKIQQNIPIASANQQPQTIQTTSTTLTTAKHSQTQTQTSTANSPRRIKNTLDKTSKIALAEKIIQYTFADKQILWEALQGGSSARVSGTRHIPQGNMRLAMVGDIVLYDIIVKRGYHAGKICAEIDCEKQAVACNQTLARVCEEKGLDRALEWPSERLASKKRFADLVEAVIGAVELEGGRDAAERLVEALGLV